MKNRDITAILPGRFQFPHKGHLKVYQEAVRKFGDCYIVTSNKTDGDKSPFNFAQKKKLLIALGIPKNRIIESRTPMVPKEFLDSLGYQSLVVVAGRKVQEEDNRYKFTNTSYFQEYNDDILLDDLAFHAYVYFVDTEYFKFDNKVMKSASELRKHFKSLDVTGQVNMLYEICGFYDTDIHSSLNKTLFTPKADAERQDSRHTTT